MESRGRKFRRGLIRREPELDRTAGLGTKLAHQGNRLARCEVVWLEEGFQVEIRESLVVQADGELLADDLGRIRRDLAQGIEDELVNDICKRILREDFDSLGPERALGCALGHRAQDTEFSVDEFVAPFQFLRHDGSRPPCYSSLSPWGKPAVP